MAVLKSSLIVFVALAALLIVALRFLVSRSLLFPASQDPLPGTLPGGKIVSYRTEDGLTLRGVSLSSERKDAPGVVFFHGNGEAAVHDIPLGQRLAELGLDVFLAEYRGYGGCPGSPSEAGLFLDGDAAIRAAGFPEDRLVIVGRSLGTGVAAEMAVRHPARLVLLISPYTSVAAMGRFVVGPLAPLVVRDRFDTLSRVSRIRSPLVVAHGTADEVIPFRMGEKVAAARPGTRFVRLEGKSHNDWSGQEELVRDEVLRAWAGSVAEP